MHLLLNAFYIFYFFFDMAFSNRVALKTFISLQIYKEMANLTMSSIPAGLYVES